ncbi:MAG: Com family DNA-binding transcriptional regulator, partial [Anaerolineaceae bacterium]|nr:Com family DNA-binding transcriptional regulator [Anaerolineaceae bacterium]
PVLRNKYIVSDDNEIPYVPEDYIRSNYTTYRRFFYYCAKCGRRMHKAKDFEENGLSCPRCGEFNEAVSRFFWN